ncbi:endothelin-converting enzyme 2-like [Haemaphysalis longicornis]
MARRSASTPTRPHLQTTTPTSQAENHSILAPLLSSVLGVALTLSVITISLTVLHYRSSGSGVFGFGGSSWNTCNSKLCLNHFRRLSDSLNRNSTPCEDFYRFACGSWQPRVAVAQTAFRDLLAVAQLDAIRYLGAAHNQNRTLPQGRILVPDPQPIQRNKAERSYRVCLYSQNSEVALLREFLANRSLSWPEHATSPAQPLDVLLDLDINWNLGLWFSIRLVPVPGHSKRMIRIGPGIVSASWKKALDALVLKGVYNARLRKFYDAMRTTNFVPMSDRDLEAHRRDESTITAALSDTTSSGGSELAFPLKQIQKLATPNLASSHWLSLLNRHLKKRHRVGETDRLLVTNVKLLQAVDGLLRSLSVESILQQLAWTLVQLLGWMADSSLPGRPVTAHMAEPRHADCLWASNRAFGLTLLSSYIDTKYPLATRAAADDILMGITQTAVNLFLKTPWIDGESRDAAIDKLRRMNTSLWPADAFLNASETSAILQPFPEPTEEVFRSWLDALIVRRALLRNRNFEAAFYSEDMQSQRALFRYYYYTNELAVSLQALTSPLYVDGGGLAVNIGGLGAHYAATLARAFDPRGVLIDGRGLATGLWWDKSSYQEYERRTTCPAGDDDEGFEGFAGVAAIEIAYASFNATRDIGNRGRSRSRRAFLGLTEDQAFFVSFCQAFCSGDPSERQRLACTAPLKSSRAFAAAFTCPVASAMNPAKRCGFFEGEGQRDTGASAGTKSSMRSPYPEPPHRTLRRAGVASSLPPTPFGMNMF